MDTQTKINTSKPAVAVFGATAYTGRFVSMAFYGGYTELMVTTLLLARGLRCGVRRMSTALGFKS